MIVSAAVFDKRDVTAPVQTCITDLNSVGSQYTILTSSVSHEALHYSISKTNVLLG
jgi:hypothetical protein